MILKILAYIKKSFLIQLSYRLAFLLRVISLFAYLVVFYFIDKLFGFQMSKYLEPYGVNYFSYALLGIAFSSFLETTLTSISGQIQEEQAIGTLESLLVSPTSEFVIIFSMVAWNFIYAFIEFIIYLLAGIFLFKIDFSNANVLSVFVIFVLSVVSFNSIAIISSSFIIVLKRGDPISWLLNIALELLGGVYFPVSVMPNWLQYLSSIFPITYAIRSLQLSIYKGADLASISNDIFILFVFSIILVPIAILSMRYALKKVKQNGTLIQY